MKKIIMMIVVAILVILGGYTYFQKQQQEDVYESITIEFQENQPIEYGSEIDSKTLVKSVSGTLKAPTIDTKTIGKQTLQYEVTKEDITRTFEYEIEVKDTQKPIITLTKESLSLEIDDSFDMSKYIKSVKDPVDGDLIYKEQSQMKDTDVSYYTYESNVDTKKDGTYQVTIKAVDQNGNKSEKTFKVVVKKKEEAVKTKNTSGDNQTEVTSQPNEKITVSKNKIICIDAGHQASGNNSKEAIGPGSSTKKAKVTTGATGVSSKKKESQINLEVALKLKSELQSRGYTVVMTRTSQNVNLSNQQRAAIGNQNKAGAVIHLHCDSLDNSSTRGAHTIAITKNNPYCSGLYSSSSSLAKKVIQAYCKETGIKNRGVSYRDDLTGLNWSKVPAIYIEMGFISNPTEDQSLSSDSFQKKCAKGIADGIDQYFK